MRAKLKIFLFCLLTWGVILGLPFLIFFVVKSCLSESTMWIPWTIGIVVFVIGILLGEWWSRFVTRLIYGAKKDH